MALDAQPHPDSDGEDKERDPVYPTGPPLKVAPESVQLTFLSLDLSDAPPTGSQEAGATHPGLEIKTPLGVRLPVFEGPLDLLLYLIRRDELDIYDIPIAPITERYLGMLDLMKELDLDVAGEFLVMAATLMRIKARMLLPTWPEGDEEEEDPRAELVRQLLEYRRFKEAALALREKEDERRLLYGRGFVPEYDAEMPVEMEPISHFLLIDVMREVLSRVGEEFFYEVELEEVRIEEKIDLVLAELRERGRVLFVDLVTRHRHRLHVVVAFMAILELARMGRVALAQEATFGQIWIYPVEKGRVIPPAVVEEGNPQAGDDRPASSAAESPEAADGTA